jgi:hypothetical protein
MINNILNNKIVDGLRIGDVKTASLIFNYINDPMFELDHVSIKVNELGIEKSIVERRSVWQWMHFSENYDAIENVWNLINKKLNLLNNKERQNYLRILWIDACSGAVYANHGFCLWETYNRISVNYEKTIDLQEDFWKSVENKCTSSNVLIEEAFNKHKIDGSQFLAKTRSENIDKSFLTILQFGSIEAINILINSGVEPCSKKGVSWANIVWNMLNEKQFELIESPSLVFCVKKLNAIMSEKGWDYLKKRDEYKDLFASWMSSAGVLKELSFSNSNWLAPWLANLEKHSLENIVSISVNNKIKSRI